MFDYSLSDIKKELKTKTSEELLEYCLYLAKYKKDSKEYLGYLLFDQDDNHLYLRTVLASIDEQFEEIKSQKHWYLIKKSWRKILRNISKCAKFSKNKELEIQMIIHFVRQAQASGVPYYAFNALAQIIDMQFKKIRTIIPQLHEDLQHDYTKELHELIDHQWTS